MVNVKAPWSYLITTLNNVLALNKKDLQVNEP